ncbi:MAG: guanylate kinase, partial [Clostridia bacterium]|nr:guanylate kinase [Clostridia bacterium]
MKKGLIIVVSGPAGSGKGTVVNLLKQSTPTLGLSVSATTRSPRPGEVDGVHYFFITKEEFERRIASGEILEHTVYCNNYYGTPKSELERITSEGKDAILEIEVEGATQIKSIFPDAVAVMLLPPGAAALEARLRGRGTETDEVIARRLERAREELSLVSHYDYVVINEDGRSKECAAAICKIVDAEHMKQDRMKY